MAREDKRVERSRQLLIEALLQLMHEHPYSKISVAQICQHSGVARPTFYLHYSTKDDLLRAYFEILFTQFYEQVDDYLTKTPDADPIIGEILFKVWVDNAALARLLTGDDIEALMLNEFKRYVERIILRYVSAHKLPVQNSTLLPYVVDFLAGASFMVIMRWIKDDFPISAEKMGALYANLVQPGLLQVLLNGKL
ncbi:MAG: TetR/AcrR family transcriptional regulator [Venatoribacter sp.]